MNYFSSESKAILDERLQSIANILMLNASSLNNIGLYNGKMGLAIFFYHYALYSKKEIYEVYAGDLIDVIFKKIRTGLPLDFETGLTGLGWGFEYLVQNEFVEADTDELLEEVDKAVASVKNENLKVRSNANKDDLFGTGLYYAMRLKDWGSDIKDASENRLILNNLKNDAEILFDADLLFDENVSACRLNSIIYFLLEIKRKKLFPEKINILLSNLPAFIAKRTDLNISWEQQSILINLLSLLAGEIEVPQLKKEYKKVIKKCTSHHNNTYLSDREVISSYIAAELSSLLYAVNLHDDEKHADISLRSRKILENETFWFTWIERNDEDDLGFWNGLAGLGLALMKGKKHTSITDSLTTSASK